MTFLIWNVRGLNDHLKQKEVVNRIRNMKIQLVGLLETRVKEYNSQSIISKYFQGWKWAHNYSTAYNGRIWVLWKEQVEVETIASNAQSITCRVKMESNHFCLSFIYGFNDGMARRSL